MSNVTITAVGTFARVGNANSAASGMCANGNKVPVRMPSATPRGTDRRVKRHSDGARIRCATGFRRRLRAMRSEEQTSELQSLMRISYAVFCLKKKKTKQHNTHK